MLLEAPVVSVSRREELPAPIVIPREQHVLACELQRELKRVGCYKGPLNGTWTPSTRRAMAKLIERVIARLSTAEPDAALYALTRAQSLDVCGSCPTGQSFDVQGRRTPAAILSGSRRTSKLSSGRDQRTDPAAWSNLRVTRSDTSSSLAGSVDSSSITKKHEGVRQSERHPRQRQSAEHVRRRSREGPHQRTWVHRVFGSHSLH